MNNTEKTSLHITEVQRALDKARIYKEEVDIICWSLADGGKAIRYQRWLVSSGNWYGGWHRVRNPRNNEVRLIPDIFIIRFNGHPVHI